MLQGGRLSSGAGNDTELFGEVSFFSGSLNSELELELHSTDLDADPSDSLETLQVSREELWSSNLLRDLELDELL